MKTLYGKDSKGNLRVWSIFTEDAEVVVKYGKLGGKIQEKRYTAVGKNFTKTKKTTPIQQAILEADAKCVKKLKSGYFHDKDDALNFDEFTPMKAHNYNEYAHKIDFPCSMQPKLNGQRLIIDDNGIAWSKQGERLKLPHHWEGVCSYAMFCGGLDGEVYAGLESQGGLSLQRIISAFRKPNEDTHKLRYYVYDTPVLNVPWSSRCLSQDEHFHEAPSCVVTVDTTYVETPQQGHDLYNQYVLAGYEGAVYRNFEGVYEYGKRSYNLIKRKPRQTTEAIVKSVDEDRNKCGVLLCELENGVQFKCLMRVDASEENYRLYVNAVRLIGKTIEVEFEEYSDSGVPTKPSGIGVRPVDNYGRPLQ